MTQTTITRTKRGFFGWVFLTLFMAFQAFMIWMIFINVGAVSEVSADCGITDTSGACAAGAAIGGGLIAVFGWFIWIIGTIILGLFAMLTRGNKHVTTTA